MLLYNMHKLLPSPEHNAVLAEDAAGEPVELTCAESEPTAPTSSRRWPTPSWAS